jgi:hypothetical protein
MSGMGLLSKKYNSKAAAIARFEKKFKECTGNKWENRAEFKKKHGRHVYIFKFEHEKFSLSVVFDSWKD